MGTNSKTMVQAIKNKLVNPFRHLYFLTKRLWGFLKIIYKVMAPKKALNIKSNWSNNKIPSSTIALMTKNCRMRLFKRSCEVSLGFIGLF